jgi:hypothetical protein
MVRPLASSYSRVIMLSDNLNRIGFRSLRLIGLFLITHLALLAVSHLYCRASARFITLFGERNLCECVFAIDALLE